MKYKVEAWTRDTEIEYVIKYGWVFTLRFIRNGHNDIISFSTAEEANKKISAMIKRNYAQKIAAAKHSKKVAETRAKAKEYNSKAEIVTSEAIVAKLALID